MSSQVLEPVSLSARELYKLIQFLEWLSIAHNFGSYLDSLLEVLCCFAQYESCRRVRSGNLLGCASLEAEILWLHFVSECSSVLTPYNDCFTRDGNLIDSVEPIDCHHGFRSQVVCCEAHWL